MNNTIRSGDNAISNQIEKALGSAMPQLGAGAKQDDGKNIDLNRGITIFGYNGCPYCRAAYAYLKRNNIPYQLMDTNKDIKSSKISKAKQC